MYKRQGLSPTVVANMMRLTVQKKFGGRVLAEEIGLPVTESGLILPCGCTGRWEMEERT